MGKSSNKFVAVPKGVMNSRLNNKIKQGNIQKPFNPPPTVNNILNLPIKSSYKLDDVRKSAIIPKPHLQLLNKLQPNFDWGGAIWKAAKHFIPGISHVSDIYHGIKTGYKWLKDYHSSKSENKSKMTDDLAKKVKNHVSSKFEGFKPMEHKERHPPGGPSIDSIHQNLIAKATAMHNNRKAIFGAILNNVQSRVNSNSSSNITMSHDMHGKTLHDGAIPNISSKDHSAKRVFTKFDSSSIIMQITAGTYTAGQILLTLPMNNSVWDPYTTNLSKNNDFVTYESITATLKTFAGTQQGGGFLIFFDPDPDSNWVIGTTGVTNLNKASIMKGMKEDSTDYSFKAKMPLIPLKDIYYINAANTDSRLLFPGTLVLMSVTGCTLAAGNELQLMLHQKGEFLSPVEVFNQSTYASELIVNQSSNLIQLQGNATPANAYGILAQIFSGFNIATGQAYRSYNSSNSVPALSRNTINNPTYVVHTPGVWEVAIDIDYGGNSNTATYSWYNGTNAVNTVMNTELATVTSRTGSYTYPSLPASISATNTGVTLKATIVTPFNIPSIPNDIGYLWDIQSNALQFTSSSPIEINTLLAPYITGGIGDFVASATVNCWKASGRINRLYTDSTITVLNSLVMPAISDLTAKVLQNSFEKCHQDLIDQGLHDDIWCQVCGSARRRRRHKELPIIHDVELEDLKEPTPSEFSEDCKIDEKDYYMSVILELAEKSKHHLTPEDQNLLKSIKNTGSLFTPKNDSMNSYNLSMKK